MATVAIFIIARAPAAQDSLPTGSWLHINGYTQHFSAPDANSLLLGTGITVYRKPGGRILRAWEADLFRDSADEPSGYVGHSWTYPFSQNFGIGVTAAAMYHRNFREQVSFGVLPVALPFLQVGNSRLMARLYYIPPVRKKTDHQVSIQLLVRF